MRDGILAPVEQLNENFAAFLTGDVELTVLENYQPMFTSNPALSADGVLQLEGYYPTQPSRAVFSYKYVRRGESWKLLGIHFNLAPVEGQPQE